jgi:hypothetical protein
MQTLTVTKNLLAGVMFVVFGGVTVAMSSRYSLGSIEQMGPGFFPMMIGIAIILIGIAVGVQAALDPGSSEVVAHWDVRPLVFILLSVFCFGLLIERAGLIVSLVVLILVSRLAGRDRGIIEPIAIVAVLTLIVIAVFVYGLQVPLKLFV